jgi:tripartite-type tricarboxylate transporter receptor subunit TctC
MSDMPMRFRCSWLTLACLLASLGGPAAAEDFYKGKTITLMVGSGEGGGYDQYARLLARHMGKYIPGEPDIIVKDQPGAGGMVMANAMYAAVPRDGLTIGLMSRDNPLEPLLGNAAAKFKPENFTWLGTSSRYEDDAFCLIIRTDASIASIADLQKPGPPALFGGQAAGGSETDMVLIAREVFRLNLRLIRGYRSSADVLLAIRRGEVQGRAITSSSVQRTMGDWFEAGKLRYLLQFGHEIRWKGLPDVPTARELARTDDDKALLELAEIPFLMSRPFIAPPEIPRAEAAILTRAFVATHADPDYLREARDLQLDVSPVPGEELRAIMARIAQTPPAVIARYKAAVNSN